VTQQKLKKVSIVCYTKRLHFLLYEDGLINLSTGQLINSNQNVSFSF